MLKVFLIGAAFAGALLGPLLPAQAGPFMARAGDTVKVTSGRTSSSDKATISFTNLPGGATSLLVYSGPELLSGTFGASNTAFTDFVFYCTDLYNYSSGSATYTVGELTSSHQPSGVNDLTTAQVNDIATLISLNRPDQSATQLAIWKTEYGAAFSFTGASAQTTTDVAGYLAGLHGSASAGVQLYQMHDTGVQGFAYVAAVPEPATLSMLAVGLLGLSRVRRHRLG